MKKFSIVSGDTPLEDTLCVFKGIIDGKEAFILGTLVFDNKKFIVKHYGKKNVGYETDLFTHFSEVLNEKSGFYFLTTK